MQGQPGKIVITGMGHYVPPHRIPNSFFDSLGIDSSGEWIADRTGIEARFSVLTEADIRNLRNRITTVALMSKEGRLMTLAEMGKKAWESALEGYHADTFNPELAICGTSVPDYEIPANAAAIAGTLGLSATSFDVNSACSSFVVDLEVACSLLAQKAYATATIFNVERYSLRLNFNDRNTCVLFGDGASCAFLETGDDLEGLEVIDVIVRSDPKGFDLVKIPTFDFFSQKGSAVQRFAIERTCEITLELLKRNHLTTSDVAYFAGHQANLRMLQSAATRLGVTPAQHLYNVNTHGNQGAVGAPSVLATHWDRFNTGDYVVVAVVGSGLTWGSALLRRT